LRTLHVTSAVPEIRWGPQIFKWVTSPDHAAVWAVYHPWAYYEQLPTKFEVYPVSTHFKDMKGDKRYGKWRGGLGLIVRSHPSSTEIPVVTFIERIRLPI